MLSLKHSRLIPLFAAMALLFQTLLPFYATYQMPTPHANTKSMAALFGEKILLCTREGFRFFTWEELQKRKQNPQDHHSQYQCGACYLTAHGQGVAPVLMAAAVLVQSILYLTRIPPVYNPMTSETVWRKFLTRSPPIHTAH